MMYLFYGSLYDDIELKIIFNDEVIDAGYISYRYHNGSYIYYLHLDLEKLPYYGKYFIYITNGDDPIYGGSFSLWCDQNMFPDDVNFLLDNFLFLE